MHIDAKTTLCGIIGNPVEHSMSPVIHNAAFNDLELNYVYLAHNVTDVKGALTGMKSLNIRGFSVTIPHKCEVLNYLDEIDSVAEQIGAVNTVVNNNGRLIGYNTDWIGFIQSLKKYTTIKEKNITLLGAGGAARAIAFGLKKEDASIIILNRIEEIEMAESLAKEIECGYGELSNKDKIMEADIIINATSVGMSPMNNDSPVDLNALQPGQIIYDIIYNPLETKLLHHAKSIGCQVISGYEMLLRQAVDQFELWTKKNAPIDVMKKELLRCLGKN